MSEILEALFEAIAYVIVESVPARFLIIGLVVFGLVLVFSDGAESPKQDDATAVTVSDAAAKGAH